MIKKFNSSPFLGFKIKQVHNEPTEAYFFLIKQITKTIIIERSIWQRTKGVKLGVNKIIVHINEKIVHVNKTIGYVNEKKQSVGLESIKETNIYDKEAGKDK